MSQFDRLDAYVAVLPNGVDSYPECAVKGAAIAPLSQQVPQLLAHLESLPAPIAEALRRPPLASSWVPDVTYYGCILAAADLLRDDDEYERHAYEMNCKMYTSPLFRILMLVSSPRRLLAGAEQRWSAFNKGLGLTVQVGDNNSATLHMKYPAHLLPKLITRGYCAAFRAAIEGAGGTNTKVVTTSFGLTESEFAASWQ